MPSTCHFHQLMQTWLQGPDVTSRAVCWSGCPLTAPSRVGGVKQGQGSLESQGQRCTSTPLGPIQKATLRGCPSPGNTGQGHWDLAVPSEPWALSISNYIKCKDISATLEAAEVDRAQLSWGSLVVVCRGPHLFVSVHAVALCFGLLLFSGWIGDTVHILVSLM